MTNNIKPLAYVATYLENSNVGVNCSDRSYFEAESMEEAVTILTNITNSYLGTVEADTPAAHAREDHRPLVIGIDDNNNSLNVNIYRDEALKANFKVAVKSLGFDVDIATDLAKYCLPIIEEAEKVDEENFNKFMAKNNKGFEARKDYLFNLNETIYYLVDETFSEDEIKFFTAAKSSDVESNLSNAEAYQQNYDLFDDVIKALDPSIHMSLVDKAEPLDWESNGEMDNIRARMIRDLKEEVITLLALKVATTNRINKLVSEMAEISAKRKSNIH